MKDSNIVIPILSYAEKKFLLRLTPKSLRELQKFLRTLEGKEHE